MEWVKKGFNNGDAKWGLTHLQHFRELDRLKIRKKEERYLIVAEIIKLLHAQHS